MNKSRLLGTACALLCIYASLPIHAAVIDMQVWSGHAYYLLDTATWSASESEAVSLGGHLATINDQSEHDWVWNTFSTHFDPAQRINLWVGYTDSTDFGASEGNWKWVSGESSNYTN